MSELKQEFEQWAKSHGGLVLVEADDGTCNNGWFPAVYVSPMTEIAWRAFANRRTQPEATKPAQDLGAAILALPLPDTSCRDIEKEDLTDLLKAAAALASPADALVAGDSDAARDAERYRFLRNGHWHNSTHPEIKEHLIAHVNRAALDAAIDAAIQAQKDGHGHD